MGDISRFVLFRVSKIRNLNIPSSGICFLCEHLFNLLRYPLSYANVNTIYRAAFRPSDILALLFKIIYSNQTSF